MEAYTAGVTMTDFETHPIGTAERIAKMEADLYAAIANLDYREEQLCAIMEILGVVAARKFAESRDQ